MKDQDDYTEADRLYGAWIGVCNRINQIDYGHADEDYPGQRGDLCHQRAELESKFLQITGESLKHG
ncbi:hypothetical protein [Pseudomonas sp.]|uniref:hypothetical protein n=1 Tax=Pseudomonas sp. TaxID=306 RepID=UPI002907081D|nr:hypothetical protein [Pseudomonas sp.]MDU4254560.1 hypothetical protein [Pseudomonas sp.]